MSSDDIRSVEAARFGGGQSPGGSRAGEPGERPPGASGRRARAPLDQVELTQPRHAVLKLLRQRILECTRAELALPRTASPGLELAPGLERGLEAWVGRLLSDQNLLASLRRHDSPREQIDRALERGMTDGSSETLDVLCELGKLDEWSWRLVSSILGELQRKICGAH